MTDKEIGLSLECADKDALPEHWERYLKAQTPEWEAHLRKQIKEGVVRPLKKKGPMPVVVTVGNDQWLQHLKKEE